MDFIPNGKDYKKTGVVALLESQGFDTKIHQLLVYFCSLIIVLRLLNEFLAKNNQYYLPVKIKIIFVGNVNEIQ